MQIVAFDADDKADGSGKAKITWLMKDQLTTIRGMGQNGWPTTNVRTWLRGNILPTIDSTIRNHIVDVNKTYYDYTDNATKTSSDNIWVASAREIFGGASYESSGPDYTALFKDNASRIKKRSGKEQPWWLRSDNKANFFYGVSFNGSAYYFYVTNANVGVCLGFCTD